MYQYIQYDKWFLPWEISLGLRLLDQNYFVRFIKLFNKSVRIQYFNLILKSGHLFIENKYWIWVGNMKLFYSEAVFNKTRNGFVRAMRSSFIDRGSTSVTTQTFHYFIQRGWFSPFSMICESSFTTVWQGMFLSFLLDFTTYILLSYQHEIAKNSGLEERMGFYSFLEGNLM